ncbi:MAG: methyltransferase domain-containing protein [Planctomycetota bacterium]|nr:methyltransferase domain-containing protein [Planctomycetota bacterium]
MTEQEHHYVLGRDEEETGRLKAQNDLWGPVTERFLDRLDIPEGARIAELGCGPGLMLESLRARAGADGCVEAYDASPDWLTLIGTRAEALGWKNVSTHEVDIRNLELEEGAYDLIFSRWVFSFLPDPEGIIARLSRALKPGGVLAIEDYNHHGVSSYPHSDGFVAVIEATRQMYFGQGGDPFVAGRLPIAMSSAGLELCDLEPTVLAGGPESGVFQWAHRFFTAESQLDNMQERGGLSDEDRALFKKEWPVVCATPGAMFYSPILMDVAGRRPFS